MNPAEILRLLQIATGLAETLAPLIERAMATASSQDQEEIRQAAENLHEQNKALTESTVARLRG